MSLADELGGAFDGDLGEGFGQSLAAEFGMDLGDQLNDQVEGHLGEPCTLHVTTASHPTEIDVR